ncbi:hypothetical protein C7B82_30330 [Stenomitos frigidus ULC18]|uniref:Uncharacterized protein n=2 Tax=Stenomitos TaxID=1844270 RepID=A0A2T1DSV3_9CYAN|nr:hypothetical protein C7B82_30330 [Stenomitos frigidus ULC18]
MGIPFVLDVAIGLIFIYLILSLLASELQELLTTLFQWRAKHLRDSIEVFLAGGSSTPEAEEVRVLVSNLYDDPLLKNVNQESKSFIAKGAREITRWLIPGNRKGAFGTQQSSGPSYIAPETFSTSLLERVGMSTLARKLTEVRLEKFAIRIVGGFKVQEGEAPLSDWEKGRIRLIAEKARKDLTNDANFATLVEEYADILHDYTVEATTLNTCVERMGESLDAYIANYPLPTAQMTEPVTISPVSMEVSQGFDPAAAPSEIPESAPTASTNDEDLVYFAKRLRAFKLSLFGADNERAILSGGLRPSLSEIAQLVDASSTTYQEVAQSYKTLLEKAVPLEALVNPELEQQLLESYPEAIEKEIVQAYPETVEEQFVAIVPDIFKTVEKQLTNRRRKTYRARQNPQMNLLKQQRRTLHKALGQLGAEQRQQVLSAVLNQFGGDERTVIINKGLEELSNEQRYIVINIVFVKLGLTNEDRSVYDNYQTYKTIQQALGKLPNSIKDSFAILARRAQSKVQQISHDVSQFRTEVEVWFDRSMERASGVYKRNAKGVAILIGLLLASATNADAFFIVNRLSNDENLRKVITDQAAQLPTRDPSAPVKPLDQELKDLKQQTDTALDDLSLPIGWKPENFSKQFECPLPPPPPPPGSPAQPNNVKPTSTPCDILSERGTLTPNKISQLIVSRPIDALKILLGWIVSGLAIAMGAPFWFDLLGKIMNVRNSGSKPQTAATKETAK